jgi:flagellar protein FlgJ
MFTGMLDQQLAQSMSSRGIGLAEIMVRQLSRSRADQALPTAPGSGSKVQQDFINRMLPHAIKAGEASGVPHTLMIGQAALESGWGQREIQMSDGRTSHNVFGIKAGVGWRGKTADVVTTEYESGVPVQRVERFRAYASYAEAFQDYARLIATNPRYAGVLRHAGDHEAVARSMQEAGYATDPRYADKLAKVMGVAETILNEQA